MRGYSAPPSVVRVLERCPSCESSRLEYEFRIDDGRVSRCTDCSLLFLCEMPPRAALPAVDYSDRVSERIAHLKASTGAAPRTVLAVVPPGAFGRVDGADVVAANDLVAEKPPDPPYDALVCIDAVDRVDDASLLLERIYAALVPDAPSSFTVASVGSTTARYAGASWRGFRSGASTFYSIDTLQSILIRHGFRQPKTYADGSLRPGSLRVRTAARLLGALGLRAVAVAAQHRSRLLDEAMTIVTVRGEAIARPRLSVIVPVYNERSTFRKLMDRLVAKQIDGIDIEIIIVESNSTDGSREEVVDFAGHPRVTVVFQDRPSGKGNAVRAGLVRATGDIVLFQDADLEYEIDDYDDLLRPICLYQRNFVIGSRHVKGSAWKIRDFNDAPVLSQVFNLGHVVFLGLLNTIYGQSLRDPFSMFKVFRRDCIAGLDFECNRFDFDFEIVIKLLRKGYRPLEIPVNYHSRSIREGKKVTMIRDPLTWFRALARFRRSELYRAGAKPSTDRA
jgi:hypothetical protein